MNNGTEHQQQQQQQPHLEETFYVVARRSSVFRVRLDAEGLSLRRVSKNGDTGSGSDERAPSQLVRLADIVGCRCTRAGSGAASPSASCYCTATGKNRRKANGLNRADDDDDVTASSSSSSDPSALLHVYAYRLKGNARRRTALTLRFRSFDAYEDNSREAQRWRQTIRALIGQGQQQQRDERRLLVLLNPKSGKGKARDTFQRTIAPLLAEAEVAYDLQVTKRHNFARELMRSQNVYAWRGVVAVGGDGIFYEILNGIFERPDWKQVLDELPLGIVPCGSGNGLARTLCHLYDEPYVGNPVVASTLAVVKGHTNAMDVIRVETKTQVLFSFLSVGWGLISDIDIESERLRAIGGQRFTIWSLARLIGLRTYRGKLFYLPAGNPQSPTSPSPRKASAPPFDRSVSQCDALSEECFSLGAEEYAPGSPPRARLDSWYSTSSKRTAYFSMVGSDYASVTDDPPPLARGPASRLPALAAPPPASWRRLEGDFIMVHAGYQTHLGEDCVFAPAARLDDGVIWLLVIRGGATRAQLLAFLLGLNSGAHATAESDTLQLVPVSAFRLEPEPDPAHPAHITVDGELVAYGPVQAEVCAVRARVMVPPPK